MLVARPFRNCFAVRARARSAILVHGVWWRLSAVVTLLFNFAVAAQDQTSRTKNIRDVTPPGVIRVYGDPQSAPKPSNVASARERILENVRVLADGTISANGEIIPLYGVLLPARNKLCPARTGTTWACGLSAIGALRQMVQARSIACIIGDDNSVGACRFGQKDISLQLLEQGWALLDKNVKDERHIEAARQAKVKKLGLWAGAPTPPR